MARKSRLERMSTGIPGLDVVTCGGLLRGGVYTVTGAPGSGKTVLCTHVAFKAASRGERVIYATLLSESPARMLENSSSFEFFDEGLVGRELEYQSTFEALQDQGTAGLLALLGRIVRKKRATLLVMDSVLAVEETAPDPVEYRRFVRDLATQASMMNCTVLLVSPKPFEQSVSEHTIVDGVIRVDEVQISMRSARQLQVLKHRGSNLLDGRHFFDISRQGVVVFPRAEARRPVAPRPAVERAERVGTGVAVLDELLRGGVFTGSTTCVLGAPGSGKTSLCLNVLAAASARGERAVYFGFNESSDRLVQRAAGISLDLRRPRRNGTLELVWQPPVEKPLDELGARLWEAVNRVEPSVVVLDGIDGFRTCAFHSERLSMFFAVLTGELRARGITTIATSETEMGIGAMARPFGGISASFDNLILLRYFEVQETLHRTLTILKTRGSAHDGRLHELLIGPRGVDLELPEWTRGAAAPVTGPQPARRPRKTAKKPRGKRA